MDLARIAKLAQKTARASEKPSVSIFWRLTHWTSARRGHSHGATAEAKYARERELREQSFSIPDRAVLEKPLQNERNAASMEIPEETNFVELQRWAEVGWGRCLGTLEGPKVAFTTDSFAMHSVMERN